MFVKTIKDVFSVLFAAALLLFAVYILGVPLWVGLGGAVLIFAGAFFLLNPGGTEQGAEAEAAAVRNSLQQSRSEVKRITGLARRMPERVAVELVGPTCKAASEIVELLRRDPHTLLSTATRLDGALLQFRSILEQYNEIRAGKVMAEPERLQAIQGRIEGEVIPQFERALRELGTRLAAEDLAGLEVSIRLLSNTCKFEGLS
jgi:hypothetical protein